MSVQSITNPHESEYTKSASRDRQRFDQVACFIGERLFLTCLQVRGADDPGMKKLACLMHPFDAHLT
jgi:hypothetical protein